MMISIARVLFLFAVACIALLSTHTAEAEPWLGSKYSQNCAGCHAPGRKNLKAIDRRCSLSCQGCHVSPNGGGLRSFYGKWTEDRWLKSYAFPDKLGHEKSTATVFKQKYKPTKAQMDQNDLVAKPRKKARSRKERIAMQKEQRRKEKQRRAKKQRKRQTHRGRKTLWL